MASSGSRYGLFIPKKSTKGTLLKPSSASVFADDSDEDSGSTAPSKNVAKQAASTRVKKQTQLEIDKALQEDPSVYEYDTIYDNIQAQKVTTSVKEANKVDRKPKYIAGLLKMAEVRKREEERRVERKVQKEREEEGNQYADKEAFVTSAYKKKMQERQEQEERERREAAMEEMLDVTKQKDLSGFYRYLYRETTGKAADEPSTAQQDRPVKQEDSGSESDSSSSSDSSADREVKHRKQDVNPRAENRHRTDSDRHRQHKSESSKDISRSDKRSKRSRSRSPEGDRRRRSNRSPEHSSHRHRHRSKDRKRNRSSSKDRVRQRSRERSRDKGSKSHKESKVRDDRPKGRSPTREKASIKVEKPSPERETEPYQSPSRERKSTIKAEKPSPEKETESEMVMLPARPPDEDLDRDDSDSERDSETGEDQSRRDSHKEAAGKKRKDEAQGEKGKDEEKAGAKFARKTTADQVLDARQRFLARKLAREKARPVVEPE